MSEVMKRRSSAVLLEQLLDGKEVCAAIFAQENNCSDNTITAILRSLGDALKKRTEPSGKRFPRSFYRMANKAVLQARYDEIKNLKQYDAPRRAPADFSELLTAWSIAPPQGCTLPSLVHRMETAEDELEAA